MFPRKKALLLLISASLSTGVVMGCGAGSGSTPVVEPGEATATMSATPPATASTATPAPNDPSARVFDDSILHTIELEVANSNLGKLSPGNDERVKARLTFDGKRLDDVGLRLKAGLASALPLKEKPGFSIDTDKFEKGRNLHGVTRLTLGNSIQDWSFVSEAVSYEVFRRAGVVAPRTALATVRLNGEDYGLYVIREGYDKNFLRRVFPDPDGNLYEGDLNIDVTDVAEMGLRTNEEKDDRSDLAALARVVAESPDETFLTDVARHVDIEQLLTYWAVETIVHHWDGYIRPNNYYIYHEPTTDRFVFLAHGTDWALLDPQYSILAEPGPEAMMAVRLYHDAEFQRQLHARIRQVLAEVWDAHRLLAIVERYAGFVRSTHLDGTHETVSMESFESELALRKAFISQRKAAVEAQLASVQSPQAPLATGAAGR